MALKLLVTDDIPATIRTELIEAWQDDGGLESGGIISLRSAEAPSFLQIMGEAAQWVTPLKLAAAVFLSQLAKEAATDVYKNKAKIANALADLGAAPLRRLSNALSRARNDSPTQPGVILGLSIPDDYFGTAISIGDRSEEEIAYLLAALVVRAETIQAVVEAEIAAGRRPLGRVQVLQSETGLKLSWMDQQFVQHEQEIP